MYERQKKKIDDFKPMDSDDAVKDSKKATDEDTLKKEEVLKEPDSTKIESMNKEDVGERVLDVSKKRKGDKEGMIDYEVLEKRFLIINWESKFYHYDRHGAEGIYYRIFRSDGSSRWIKTFSKMVTRFDRLDLVELYNLKMNSGRIKKDGIEIHMLAERKYPLTKETLKRVMSLKLIDESTSDSGYDLLRFIQKHIDEAGSHDGGEKDL
ncbi:hypothetical protein Tco_0849962 [Tanacetum coccineum]